MIVLGVDSAMATCGWAIVRRKPFALIDFDVITTDRNAAINAITDRSRRIAIVASKLTAICDEHAVTFIAAEQPLGFGTVHAVLPQAMCFAALLAIAVQRDVDMAECAAKDWQHAVMPERAGKAIDYAALKAELATFAGPRLARVPAALQTHALDAIGVATFAAMQPQTLVWRGKARRERDAEQREKLVAAERPITEGAAT